MYGLDLALRLQGTRGALTPGGGPWGPAPAAMLPTLTTAGASYHAVYALSRLMPDYAGPLAYVVGANDAPGDIGAGKTDLTAADLPRAVTQVWGVYDQSGGARHLQQPVLARQPRLRAEATIGRRLALAFPGLAYTNTAISLSGAQAVATTNRTEFFVVDPTTSSQNAVWSEHANASTVIRDAFIAYPGGAFQAAQTDSMRHVHAGPQVIAIVERGAGDASLYLDGVAYPLAGGNDLGVSTQVMLGASVFGQQYNANLRLGAYVAVAGALSAGDVSAVTAALRARFGLAAGYLLNIVHIGDSIVQDTAATDTIGLRAQIDPLLTRRARWWNLGIGGKTLAACYADRGTHEAVLLAPGKINLALIDAGINDLGFGSGGAALYADTAMPYVAALKAMGYTVGLVTLLPQASTNYPRSADAIEVERLLYNAAARANAAGADLVIDRAAEAQMGSYPASCLDPALYSATVGGAALHPTTVGYGHLAPVYAAAIDAVG